MNPAVMAGKPVITGTRIPVETTVRMLAHGVPEAEVRREYRRLDAADVRAALAYAASVGANEDGLPPPAPAAPL
ncbi:MAG: DUF433 domain-containing protein [Chloroflexota bacterium]